MAAEDRVAAWPSDSVPAALNRVGRRLNVHDVQALEELYAAFHEWAAGKGPLLWTEDIRLARAIAAVIHVELVEAEDGD